MSNTDATEVSRSIVELEPNRLVNNQRPLIVDLSPLNGQPDEPSRVALVKIMSRVLLSMEPDERQRVVFLGDKHSADCAHRLMGEDSVSLMQNPSFKRLLMQ